VPTDTPAPVAVAVSDSPRGNLLTALLTAPTSALPGAAETFSPTSDGWLLSSTDDGEALVVIPPDLLSALFQPNAANTIRRVDATLELMGYDPDALGAGEVAFGLGVQNPTGQRTIVEVRYAEPGLVSMGLDQNGRFRPTTEFPRRDTSFALSVRRSSPNALGFYVNDQWLGDSVFLYTQGEPLTLALYAAGPGVTVQVRQFTIDYSPRDDIP
jgi:hypothetical protein